MVSRKRLAAEFLELIINLTHCQHLGVDEHKFVQCARVQCRTNDISAHVAVVCECREHISIARDTFGQTTDDFIDAAGGKFG